MSDLFCKTPYEYTLHVESPSWTWLFALHSDLAPKEVVLLKVHPERVPIATLSVPNLLPVEYPIAIEEDPCVVKPADEPIAIALTPWYEVPEYFPIAMELSPCPTCPA